MTKQTTQTNGANDLPALCHSAADFLSHSYDFIIIGGGTGGLCIAARLSEDPNTTVGVIEAGSIKLDDPLVDTPTAFPEMLGNPDYDYNFKSVPQEGNRGIVHHISRGKLLGGSSGINYMMYVRGSSSDYDDWGVLAGDSSWSAEKLKPYMRKHETLEPIDPTILDRTSYPFVGEHHGTSGPIHTSFNDSSFPIEDKTIKAMDEVAGLSKKPVDPWSGDHIGFFNTLGSVYRSGILKGKRSYSARGYFQDNASRPNLKVLCDAQVKRIILQDTTATGVEFTHGNETETVKINKEVILCGGVFGSPQILELSGIGRKDILEAAGVECIVELPGVGENYQDHVLTLTGLELSSGNKTMDSFGDASSMEEVSKALSEHQSGPLTCISSVQGFFSYKSQVDETELKKTVQSIRKTQNDSKSPFYKKQLEQIIVHLENEKSANLQHVVIPCGCDFENGVQTQKIWKSPDNSIPNRMTIATCLQYPVARGSCHITTSDPTVHPKINPAYLGHEADVSVLSSGLHFVHKMTKTSEFSSVLKGRTFPAPSVDLDDKTQREEAVRDFAMGEYHSCGTCSLGDVLDGRLKVKGVKGLRVVDASIFPNNVSGNIQSSVYMVAERGADILKEDWGYAVLDRVKELEI